MQNEKRDVKSKVNEYLSDKTAAIALSEEKMLQIKSLADSLEIAEVNTLRLKNVIYKKRKTYSRIKGKIIFWIEKRKFSSISSEDLKKVHGTKEKIIKELENDLQQVNLLLREVSETTQPNIVELTKSQVQASLILSIILHEMFHFFMSFCLLICF